MRNTSGNILFMILIAIALLAALTYAMSGSMRGGGNISDDQLRVKVDRLMMLASDIKTGVSTIYSQGVSESDLSFAHPSLTGYGTIGSNNLVEIFNEDGGGVGSPEIPSGLNDGSQMEFYGHTRAPRVGQNTVADLLLVVPNMTESACRAVNMRLGYTEVAPIPQDNDGDSLCVYTGATGRFVGTFETVSPNQMDGGTPNMTILPAPFGCVTCESSQYHMYYTLLER